MSKKIQNTIEEIKLSDSEKEQLLENIWNNKDVHSEKNNMRMINKLTKVAAAVAIIATVGVCSVSAYEYVRELLTPKEVVNLVTQNNELANKFGKSPQDVVVQEFNDYTVSYLGYVTKKDLPEDDFGKDLNKLVHDGVTSVIIAIEPKVPINPEEDDFYVMPLIQGMAPGEFPICTEWEMAQSDGVYYIVANIANDLDTFGYDKVYLGVTKIGASYSAAYSIEKDGNVIRNKDCQDLNALFEVKTDKSKANKEKAVNILNEFYYGENGPDAIEEYSYPGDVQPTDADFKAAIANSTLVLGDDELPVDVIGRPVYGMPGITQWSARKNYISKTGNVDYQWNYDRDKKILHIFAVELKDGKFYQNVYKYNGNAREDLKWVQSYCEIFENIN